MNWKEIDLQNISLNKKTAISSSISKWSKKDEANLVLDSDFESSNFILHTDYEKNPWWMVDLEEIFDIALVRVENRKDSFKERLKNVKLEFSLDKIEWTKLSDSFRHFSEDLQFVYFDVPQVKARYIKIYLEDINFLHINKVEIYKSKYKGRVVTGRPDAFGCRMLAFLNAFYIANKLDYKFYFVWDESNGKKYIDQNNEIEKQRSNLLTCDNIPSKEDLFDKDFLEKHALNQKATHYTSFNNECTLKDLSTKPLIFYNIIRSNFNVQIIKDIEGGFHSDSHLKELSKIYKNLPFAQKYKDILIDVKQKASSLNKNNSIFIHSRGGEHIYSNDLNQMPDSWMFIHYMPPEIAIELCKNNLELGNSIILLGQNPSVNLKIKNYFKNKNKDYNISLIDEQINPNYNTNERTFFEVNFISYANELYSSGGSSFAFIGQYISGRRYVKSFFDIYEDKEIYEIMLRNFNILDLDNYYKAYSMYMIYKLSRKVASLDTSIKHIKECMHLNNNNGFYKLQYIDCLFEKCEFEEIENFLKQSLNDDYSIANAMEVALSYPAFTLHVYKNLFDKYANIETISKYPYICLLSSLVHKNYFKDTNACIEFLKKFQDSNYNLPKTMLPPLYEYITCYSAVARVRSHLRYKLGREIIKNSKSLKGYLLMPFYLLRTYLLHNKNLNKSLKKPLLKECLDYEKALKEKECFTYKLGEAFMKSCKYWYKGALIKFYFEAKKLEKEFKEKQKGQ